MKKISSTTSFILSFIPGLGQIYLGSAARGIVYLVLLLADFAFNYYGSNTYRWWMNYNFDPYALTFMVSAPLIWLVSFVDSLFLRRRVLRKAALSMEPGDGTLTGTPAAMGETEKKTQDRKLIATALSVFPGAGHMYMGLFVQGIEFMCLFLACFYLNALLNDSIFMFFVPVVWFYGLFDAFSKASSEKRPEDGDILFILWAKKGQSGSGRNYKFAGYILVLIALFSIVNRIAAPVASRVFNNYNLIQYIQIATLALVFLAGGIKLVSMGRKKTKAGETPSDDIEQEKE